MSTITMELLAERVSVLEKQLALLLSEKAVDVSESKTTKKSKKPKDDDNKSKKKRTSGYILYSNAHRDQVKDSFTNDDEKPKNTDIMKKLAPFSESNKKKVDENALGWTSTLSYLTQILSRAKEARRAQLILGEALTEKFSDPSVISNQRLGDVTSSTDRVGIFLLLVGADAASKVVEMSLILDPILIFSIVRILFLSLFIRLILSINALKSRGASYKGPLVSISGSVVGALGGI